MNQDLFCINRKKKKKKKKKKLRYLKVVYVIPVQDESFLSLKTRAGLFGESRLTLIYDLKLIEVFISLFKSGFKPQLQA